VGIGSFFGLKIMLLIFLVSFLIQAAIGIPMTFYLWIKNRIFKPALLTLLGFILVSIPYILQLVIPSSSLLLIITLGLGAIAVYCSIKALKIVKSNGLQFHGIPFGPTIVLGCLLMVFFEVPILSFFRLFLPV
jgi:hypothetical protein